MARSAVTAMDCTYRTAGVILLRGPDYTTEPATTGLFFERELSLKIEDSGKAKHPTVTTADGMEETIRALHAKIAELEKAQTVQNPAAPVGLPDETLTPVEIEVRRTAAVGSGSEGSTTRLSLRPPTSEEVAVPNTSEGQLEQAAARRATGV